MTESPRSTTGAVVAAVLVGVWAVGVTVPLQGVGWLADQVLVVYAGRSSWWIWPALSVVNAVLVAIPALLLALLSRSDVVRATGRAWLGGAIAVGVLGAVRAVPSAEPELYLALLAALAAGLALLLRALRVRPVGSPEARPDPSGVEPFTGAAGPAATAGLVVLLPWLWFGALGGVLETALAVAAAAAIGWLASTLPVPRLGGSRIRRVLVGGLAAGVTLLLVAAAAGGSGAQLALLLVLPPLGFVVAALPRGHGILVGLAASGPLGFVDPEEISLLLATGRDVPLWTVAATVGSLILGLVLGVVYGLLRSRLWRPGTASATAQTPRGSGRTRRWLAASAALAALLAGTALYLGLGQPGFHGERLFVVMADQADLSGLPSGAGQAGRDARAAEVYRRLVTHAGASQADLRAELDRFGLAYTPYYLVNAIEVSGGPEVRAWLSRRSDIDRVLRSQRLRPLPRPVSPMGGTAGLTPEDPEWNIAMVGADRVWRELGITGEGIVVGTVDSGVDGRHPALADRFRGGDDSWLDPWNGTTAPTDRNGHGTHTLGSALGRGGIGVAPGAQWTACASLDRNLGNPARYLDCLQFMLAPYPHSGDPWRDGRPERAPHVLTNSWGCPPIEGCDRGVLDPAAAALRAAGLYLVVAAGNTGPFCETIADPLAPDPDVLTVGAVNREQQVAFFSSRGPVDGASKPDLVAPGSRVVSAVPGGGYRELDGTSMATPHVAGVVALMWSANPDLIGDVDTTSRILRETARPVTVEEPACGGPESLTGAGLVDAHAAVLAATL